MSFASTTTTRKNPETTRDPVAAVWQGDGEEGELVHPADLLDRWDDLFDLGYFEEDA